MSLITLAWLGHVTWRNGNISFWCTFPPSVVIVVFKTEVHCDVFKFHMITWPKFIPYVGWVLLHTIQSLPQNLIQIKYPFWKFILVIYKISITKWDSYYKMRQKTGGGGEGAVFLTLSLWNLSFECFAWNVCQSAHIPEELLCP